MNAPTTTPTRLETALEVRGELVDRINRELVGPWEGNEELLVEPPTSRYLLGGLHPWGDPVDPTETENEAAADSGDDADDSAVPASAGTKPSVAGITTAIDDEPTTVHVLLSGGRYVRASDDEAREAHGEGADDKSKAWRRRQIEMPLTVTVEQGKLGSRQIKLADDLEGFELVVRTGRRADGGLSLTIVLSNRHRASSDFDLDLEHTLFQSRLDLKIEERPFRPVFDTVPGLAAEEDRQLNQLLYRSELAWGVGHGCSVTWDTHASRERPPMQLASTWLPRTEVHPVNHAGDAEFQTLSKQFGDTTLSAAHLAGVEQGSFDEALSPLVAAYDAWLVRTSAQLDQDLQAGLIPANLESVARDNLAACDQAKRRIAEGIKLLDREPRAATAFAIANLAMNEQRRVHKGGGSLSWRPFQLAFMLQCLPSVALDEHDDRNVMDLLWFPTGGGKTEAYLGLAAFTMLHRRLTRTAKGGGTSILMRYTLRALTLEQFERAAAMVCQLELVRRGTLGTARDHEALRDVAPFSIGLWAGESVSPNRIPDSAGDIVASHVLGACPACATARPRGVEDGPKHRQKCRNDSCAFSRDADPIPTYVVDDDIYAVRPSFVLGTIDKFAQLARNADSGNLFGIPGMEPPDLIIQDELHLISGPLGTIAGAYETVIDLLCSRDGDRRPKIVGSTATISNARHQVQGLFDREVAQFPPPALDAGNSGFAVIDRSAPGRLYVGISNTGRSQQFALQAVDAAVLQHTWAIAEYADPAAIDPYWTMVNYFNALRELGGGYLLLQDDVQRSMSLIADRIDVPRRSIDVEELTSQRSAEEIQDTRRRLLDEFDGDEEDALDALLATNMISVGIDIPRLGIMVMNGQPKTTAEYIQATSRVGREHPGLVLTLYNAYRPRDRSCYEQFTYRHRAIYAAVEPVSVTPWAPRARDRTATALLVAACRHLIPDMRDKPNLDGNEAAVEAIVEKIVRRVEAIDPGEASGLRAHFDHVVNVWEGTPDLKGWWGTKQGVRFGHRYLVMSAEEQVELLDDRGNASKNVRKNARAHFGAPNTMRNVEPGVEVVLLMAQPNQEEAAQ